MTSLIVYYQLNKREKRLKREKYLHKKNDDTKDFNKTNENEEVLKSTFFTEQKNDSTL